VPEWIEENCIQCNKCAYVCPHATIRPFVLDEAEMAEELTYFVNSEHIDRFDYSTPNAPKEISTVFMDEI
ncbi:MAG: 4Fe-4S binding protein, partial [Eubacterium sp.]|nr:4Fe-4S binding protein [Eubacterium sp.]